MQPLSQDSNESMTKFGSIWLHGVLTRASGARPWIQSANAAEEHLKALARKEYIELTRGASRGIRLLIDDAGGTHMIGKVFKLRSAQNQYRSHHRLSQRPVRQAPDYLLPR